MYCIGVSCVLCVHAVRYSVKAQISEAVSVIRRSVILIARIFCITPGQGECVCVRVCGVCVVGVRSLPLCMY